MFDWIVGFVEETGYLGVALLMFIENVFPPIPSELIMPLAGFNAARNGHSLALVILAGLAGSVSGTLVWYALGRRLTLDSLLRLAARHGRWLTVTPRELEASVAWFRRHSGKSVLIGRLIPGVRTLISVPAGIARMKLARFLAYSTAGSAIWTGLLALLGYLLEDRYDRVAAWVNPVSDGLLAALVVLYLYRVVTFDARRAG